VRGLRKLRFLRGVPAQWRALSLGVLTAVASAAFAGLGGGPELSSRTQQLSLSLQPVLQTGLSAGGHADLPNPLAFTRPDQQTPTEADSAEPSWTEYTVKPGETLSQLGERIGLGSSTGIALARACADTYPARKIRAGHAVRVRQADRGSPASVRYEIDDRRYLAWRPDGEGGFKASIETYPRTVQVQEAFGRIETSLFEAGTEAGLSDKITMELARIFGWDIDFAHDLRRGDWFRVLYQEIHRDGEKVADGAILAAEFVTRGEAHRAIRFTDAQGRTNYFHPDGRSVRKAFLRSPVRFDRITSGFSRSREHPILGHRRAHEGVDYGASTGTPVRTTGDGRVVFRGRNGGYGHMVKIRHAGRFTTVYAHLSRFANIRSGQRVKQGQTIGYVGQSGLATGPHLHYEFRLHGRPRNPLKVDLPDAEPLAKKYRDEFRVRSHHYGAWLESVGPERIRVAFQEAHGPAS
jgi:murein DD-endopeptidase MepM/ murein hydrolase activator NlpD